MNAKQIIDSCDVVDKIIHKEGTYSLHTEDRVRYRTQEGKFLNNMKSSENRPWGFYEILLDTDYTKVKEITVNPGQRLSYQYHNKRKEYWTIVQGSATIILDDEKVFRNQGESIHIPLGAKHRIINEGDSPLIFIEVQVGEYFGEDDIVRIEDDYGR